MGVAARAVGDEEREREVSRLDARVEVLDSDEASGLDDSGEAAPVTGEGDRTGDRLAAGHEVARVRSAAGERAFIGSLAETAGEGAVDDGMGDRIGELAWPLRRSGQRGGAGRSDGNHRARERDQDDAK